MHPYLSAALDAAAAHFRNDDRVLGMYLHGSIGRGETDAYSDIDVCAVVRDERYDDLKHEMRATCEAIFGPIVCWLPEGEQPGYCNFAFLFEHGNELLLTDFDIISRSLFEARRQRPDRVLWDREGLLQAAASSVRAPAPVSAGQALHVITAYWVYAYLNGKYFCRRDVFKMLYVQQTLLQLHVRALGIMACGEEGNWWAGDVARLDRRDRNRLRVYFAPARLSSLTRAFARSLEAFASDARRLCATFDADYPTAQEAAVCDHLRSMGLPTA